jgi:hypothetical protein
MARVEGNMRLPVTELSLAAASEQWANALAYLAAQNREIERLRRGEKFISFYRSIEAGRIRTVYVLFLPSGMGCRRCHGRDYWSHGDEPDLYRCARCFVRPPSASQRDLDYRLLEILAEKLIARRSAGTGTDGRVEIEWAGRPTVRESTRDQVDHLMKCTASDCFLKVRFYEEPGKDGWWCWKPCPHFEVVVARAPRQFRSLRQVGSSLSFDEAGEPEEKETTTT